MQGHLTLFGRPALWWDSTSVPLRSRKGQALLWYLASHPDESFPREYLRGFLWDDVSHQTARQDFNTMYSRLRRELPLPCIMATRDRMQWNSEANISADAQRFAQLTKAISELEPATNAHSLQSIAEATRNDLYQAIELYTGPFLDGFSCASETYEEWLGATRLQWETRMLRVLNVLLGIESNANQWDRVSDIARRALEIDPLEESFHRAAIRAYMQQGRRTAAVTHFEMCRSILREELGIEPDATTQALYDEIKLSETLGTINTPTEPITGVPTLLPANSRLMTQPTHPLIGRQTEFARIQAVLKEVAGGGRNHSVLLSGEAGIGKTRLLTEITMAVSARSPEGPRYGTLLVGGAYETMIGVPYAVFIEALESKMHEVDFSALGLPDIFLRELGRLLPDVHAFRPDLGAPGPAASGDDRLRLFQAVSRLLSALPQPVFVALEDLQWADRHSLALLSYLIRGAPNQLKLAALLTVRTGDETDTTRHIFHTLEREQMLTRLELGNLKDVDTATLVEKLFPEGNPQNGPRIFAQTHGHPLYTVELAIMLRDTASLQNLESGASSPLPVPPTVHDVFMGRLNRMDPTAFAIAEALAVFRHQADLHQLRQVATVSEAETVSGLNALVKAGIVAERHDETIAFSHDVFRQVVLGRLTKAQRGYLHRQAYAVLSEHVSNPKSDDPGAASMRQQQLADLIDHAVGGRLWDEAVIWTREAAATAHRLSALPTAVERLEQALNYLSHLPDTAERRKQAIDIELYIATLDYWSNPAERDARLDKLTARAVAEELTSLLPHIQLAQATSYIAQGRCPEAKVILESLLPLAVDGTPLAIHLDAWQGTIAYVTGDIKQALAHFDRASQALEQHPDLASTSLHAGITACYAALGQFDNADATLAVMEAEEKARGYTERTGTFCTTAATVAYFRGDWQATLQNSRQGLDRAFAADDAYNETISGLWLGAASVELGDTKAAIQTLEEALEASKRAQTYLRRDLIYAYLASAYVKQGDYERADTLLTTGLELAKKFDYKEGYALCTEIQGRLAAARGKPKTAVKLMEHALRQFADLSISPRIARCQRQLTAFRKDIAPNSHALINATRIKRS